MTGAITSTSPGRLGRAALPIVAILVFAAGIGVALAVAGDTLGFDFRAYYQAARRLLDGGPLYITDFTAIGPFGLYLYPPTAILLVLPLALLTETTAVLAWTALMVAAFAVGVLVLPVSRTVRWWIVLLAGLSWPFAYAIKLGQVGPLLFLTFAVGWRWLDDPVRLGASAAIGSALKLQPGLVFVWAALTGRWRALGIGVAILAVAGRRGHPAGRTVRLAGLPVGHPHDRRADHDAEQRDPGRGRLPGRALDGGRDGDPDRERRGGARRGRRRRASRDRRGRPTS